MSFIDGTIDPNNDRHIVSPELMCNACGDRFAEQPYGLCTECKYTWIYTGALVRKRFNQELCADPNCNHHDGAHVRYGYDFKAGKVLRVCMMFDYKNKRICGCREFKIKPKLPVVEEANLN